MESFVASYGASLLGTSSTAGTGAVCSSTRYLIWSATVWLISTTAMSSRVVKSLNASSMAFFVVLPSTTRKFVFRRTSTFPTPASKNPVTVSSSPITPMSEPSPVSMKAEEGQPTCLALARLHEDHPRLASGREDCGPEIHEPRSEIENEKYGERHQAGRR